MYICEVQISELFYSLRRKNQGPGGGQASSKNNKFPWFLFFPWDLSFENIEDKGFGST